MEFDKVYDFGILGMQEANVDYEYDGYKVLGFSVWLFNFSAHDCVDVTDYLTDKASDMIYEDCHEHLMDYLIDQAEMAADMER